MTTTARVDIRVILANPVLRKKMMVSIIIATQAREGIATTVGQAEAAYDKVQQEKARPMTPVCETCSDTHKMDLHGATVMCTRCPLPCQECRQNGTGPFCESTPCSCTCHKKRK